MSSVSCWRYLAMVLTGCETAMRGAEKGNAAEQGVRTPRQQASQGQKQGATAGSGSRPPHELARLRRALVRYGEGAVRELLLNVREEPRRGVRDVRGADERRRGARVRGDPAVGEESARGPRSRDGCAASERRR